MRLISIACAAAIAVVALVVTSDAFAQRNRAASVVVVNYQRVIAESAIGRDMTAKLQQVAAQIGQERQALAPEGTSLEQERQRLAQTTRNMSAEQIRSNQQVQAFAQRERQFQQRAQALQGDFECTQLVALRDLQRQIEPVVRGVVESRGAGVALDAANTSIVLPDFDVTSTVIQQLDQNGGTRTANVTRRPVSECLGQQGGN